MSEQVITNRWSKLLKRTEAANPTFKRLSFKHLRKTFSQLIRNLTDGETAAVLLCHGEPVKADKLADIYSRPNFEKCHDALRQVRGHLRPVLEQLEDHLRT